MLKHIVMWKLKEQAEGADRATNAVRLKALLEGCRNIVPGIRRFEVGVATPGLEATYDVVLVSEFDNKAALEAYAVHPEHEKIKAFVASVRDARQCIDYEA
ncbi:Stress responsive alpha-beta barrel domain protein [Mycetohabitans rhizoxinica HKI 454]|uniref:Stress responsive alpha-beta barrel domain protein n=1 Tax=Mycetohabitans rhizoxinica (strain DSM 19002 / CIP 109453 / HKI 454) TaxID=882378 RepID=E5ARE9_MYCRK|nr:Dabb family protein [Mycetohabitans rhizoxinica]CBW75181.1 Stress responsive alpha-beta barrel domain protein [Mycetohabitans rhizoxinica HKI 454]